MVHLPRFSTEVSSFIYEFLDQMFIEAQTRVKLHACPLPTTRIYANVNPYFLKKILETCWMTVFFGKDVLRVEI
jgi:hypothetical protein